MKCPSCRKRIEPQTAWKGLANRFYCSEFCAETENAEPARSIRSWQKAEIDRQYLARLERLLPLRRSAHPYIPA